MRKLIGAGLVVIGVVMALRTLRRLDADRAQDQTDLDRDPASAEEPVLGYDGMDLQTVIPWLESAELDPETLQRIRSYEQRNRARESVLNTIEDLLNG